MNKNSNIVLGSILILLGAAFLLTNLGFISFSWSYVWPLFLLIPGVYMHFSFFSGLDKNPGILVPAGILTTYGILFYANVLLGWHYMAELWPLFIIGIAVGLFELYFFGTHDRALLIPVTILGGLGVAFMAKAMFLFNFKYLAPIILIGVGVLVLFKKNN